MSGLSFRRRIGAAADVKELEYCVALHQTVPRDNATVSSTDIRCLLASRYGLKLSQVQAAALVQSLGGSTVTSMTTTMTTMANTDSIVNDQKNCIQPTTPSTDAVSEYGGYDHRIRDEKHTHDNNNMNDNNDHWFETAWDHETGEVTVQGKGHQESLLSPVIPLSDEPHHNNNHQGQQRRPRQLQQDVPEEYLDLVQLMSILLLPSMARAGEEFHNGPKRPPNLQVHVGNYWFTQPFWKLNYKIQSWSANRWYGKYQKCRPQPEGLMMHMLKALLTGKSGLTMNSSSHHDEYGSRRRSNKEENQGKEQEAPILDEALVEDLLVMYGEVERAQDLELIHDMVQVAQTKSGRLDHEALVQAVTMDLSEWKVESEDHLSTMFKDVFGTSDPATVPNLEFLEALKDAEKERILGLKGNEYDRTDHQPVSVDAYMSGVFDSRVMKNQLKPGQDDLFQGISHDKDRSLCRDALEKMGHGLWICFRFLFSVSCCCFLQGKSLGPFDNERFHVDMVTDEHSSLVVVVVTWLFFLFT
jgi:hypothetical protein